MFCFLVCDCVELVYLMPNAHSKTHSKPPGVALAHLNRNAKSVKNAQNLRQTRADVTLFAKRVLSCVHHTTLFLSFVAEDYWESSVVLEVIDMIKTNFYHANSSLFSATVVDATKTLGFETLG